MDFCKIWDTSCWYKFLGFYESFSFQPFSKKLYPTVSLLAGRDRNGMKQIHLYRQLKNHDGWQITIGKLMFTSAFSFSFQNI